MLQRRFPRLFSRAAPPVAAGRRRRGRGRGDLQGAGDRRRVRARGPLPGRPRPPHARACPRRVRDGLSRVRRDPRHGAAARRHRAARRSPSGTSLPRSCSGSLAGVGAAAVRVDAATAPRTLAGHVTCLDARAGRGPRASPASSSGPRCSGGQNLTTGPGYDTIRWALDPGAQRLARRRDLGAALHRDVDHGRGRRRRRSVHPARRRRCAGRPTSSAAPSTPSTLVVHRDRRRGVPRCGLPRPARRRDVRRRSDRATRLHRSRSSRGRRRRAHDGRSSVTNYQKVADDIV